MQPCQRNRRLHLSNFQYDFCATTRKFAFPLYQPAVFANQAAWQKSCHDWYDFGILLVVLVRNGSKQGAHFHHGEARWSPTWTRRQDHRAFRTEGLQIGCHEVHLGKFSTWWRRSLIELAVLKTSGLIGISDFPVQFFPEGIYFWG